MTDKLASWARETTRLPDFQLDREFLRTLCCDPDGLGARHVWVFQPPRGYSVQTCAVALLAALERQDREDA